MNEQQRYNFTKLFCNLILKNNNFTQYLNQHFSDFNIFQIINYQIFVDSISQSEKLSNGDNDYQTLLLSYILKFSTKENIFNFTFCFLNNFFIFNLTLFTTFFKDFQNFINNIQFFHHIPSNEEELYFLIFSQLLMNQITNDFSLSKVSKNFTQIQLTFKNFPSDLVLYFIKALFQFSSEQLYNILSSFLFHFFYINYLTFSNEFRFFIIDKLSPFIKQDHQTLYKFLKFINQYIRKYDVFLSNSLDIHLLSFILYPIEVSAYSSQFSLSPLLKQSISSVLPIFSLKFLVAKSKSISPFSIYFNNKLLDDNLLISDSPIFTEKKYHFKINSSTNSSSSSSISIASTISTNFDIQYLFDLTVSSSISKELSNEIKKIFFY
jgi:hypothetical protein